MAESSNDFVEAISNLVKAHMLEVNTCLQGEIVSYENGFARVRPMAKKRYADGDVLDFPIIPRVRICWPSFSGGNAGVKGPVKAGDKCLIVFSQQAIDNSDDRRMFDLTDAYAIMHNVGEVVGQSSNNADMIMFFGSAYIKLTAGGALEINAPAGAKIIAPLTTHEGDVKNTGTLTSVGLLTYQSGMAGSGGSGASAQISGSIQVSGGDVVADGKSLKSHVHGGVQPGGGTTAPPT